MAGSVVVIGGTSGLGREVAAHYAAAGRDVVLTGTSADRAGAVAAEIGSGARGLALDLSQPETIAGALADVGPVDHLCSRPSRVTTTPPPTTACPAPLPS